ncbi:tyrosine--tRNA ligase [Patescibacteria group bacterium]|nr:tyrosine--tRNA ligase [Patescibacteria group bacterium]
MNFGDVLQLSSKFSVQRMMERDMFEKRFYGEIQCPNGHWMIAKNIMSFHINNNGELDTESIYDPIIGCLECAKTMDINSKNNFRFSVETAKKRPPTPIYVHEFMYPMMQAYDSVVMDVDGEVGGNDQTFNMLAGRDLMKQMKNKEKFVLTMKLLADTSGKKMGKSEGNMVALSDSPEDMFGKVMSWSDGMIAHGFELCTKVSDWELMKKEAKSNPRDTKLKLAYEVAKLFLGESSAKKGKAHFESVIVKKDAPSEMPEYKLKGSKNVADVLVESKLCSSKSDARRAIEQGGVSLDGNKIENFEEKAIPGILKKGKRHFVKII